MVNFIGTLPDGTVFNSNKASKKPFGFKLGSNQVIKGWELVVPKMMVGEHAKFTFRAPMAFGTKEAKQPLATVPKNFTVHYEIELLSVK